MPPADTEPAGPTPGDRSLAALLGLVVLLGVVRLLEVLAGVHERVGALAASGTLVLAVALGFALTGRVPRDRRTPRHWRRAVVVGVVGVAGVQAAAHALAVGAVAAAGGAPTVRLVAVNPVTKSTAAGQVGPYLAFGVVAAAVGQELLFRGALLGALARRLSFRRANAVQGLLFGTWHLAWPLAVGLAGPSAPAPLAVTAVGFVLVTGVVGGVYGALARATGTVWTPVLAHLLHNLAAVVLHVGAPGGTDPGGVLSAALVAGYAGLAWWALVRWRPSDVPPRRRRNK